LPILCEKTAARQPLRRIQCLRKARELVGRLRANLRREIRWLHELAARLLLLFRQPRHSLANQARRRQNSFHLFRLRQRISTPCPPVYFKPACLRILFNAPGGTSTFGLPDTVTVPDCFGFLNWRWLPLVRAKYHPRSSRSLIMSLTFTYLFQVFIRRCISSFEIVRPAAESFRPR